METYFWWIVGALGGAGLVVIGAVAVVTILVAADWMEKSGRR